MPRDGPVPDEYSFCENKSTIAALSQAFDAAFSARVASWRDRLEELHDKGRRVVAWGAGAKAVTFLNIIDPVGSLISHVVDINPRKLGRFLPGTGHQIVAPSTLRELHADVVLVINAIYRDEIASDIAILGLNSELLVV